MPGPLAGVAVLVTRPREQAEGLASAIQGRGGTAIFFPAIEIAPPTDPHVLAERIGRLAEFDFCIFISPTAVDQAWPRILARHGDWPRGHTLAAVGGGTLRSLQRYGARGVLVPEAGADSESLLALPELRDMTGKRVLIFRGEGGREVLADTLKRRGARVEYAECYRRVKPRVDPAPLLDLWRGGGIHAVVVTSREILTNLLELLGDAGLPLVRDTPMFTLHERIAAEARERGVVNVHVTLPGDTGLLAALVERYGDGRGR